MAKRCFACIGAVGVFLSLVSTARAAVIVNDTFDTYANQAAFEAVWPAVGTTTVTTLKSAQLSTARFVSAPNSILVPISTTAATASTEYRNRGTFADTPVLAIGDELVWSFDFYDSITGNPQRNQANLQDTTAPGSANQLIGLGLNNNQLSTQSGGNYYMGRILGYTVVNAVADPDGGPMESGTTVGAGAYFKLNDPGAPLRSVGWHNLKVIITLDPGGASYDYQFFVDNVLAEKVDNIGTAASLRQYDNILIGSGLTNGTATANFDNMFLEIVVPEPASLALLSIAGLSLLRRRREL